MLVDKVSQNIVCFTAVDPEKKIDEHVLYLKTSLSKVHEKGHEMTMALNTHHVNILYAPSKEVMRKLSFF